MIHYYAGNGIMYPGYYVRFSDADNGDPAKTRVFDRIYISGNYMIGIRRGQGERTIAQRTENLRWQPSKSTVQYRRVEIRYAQDDKQWKTS